MDGEGLDCDIYERVGLLNSVRAKNQSDSKTIMTILKGDQGQLNSEGHLRRSSWDRGSHGLPMEPAVTETT